MFVDSIPGYLLPNELPNRTLGRHAVTNPNETQRIRRRLQEFFPSDDPESAWLLRLMIIRDDLKFEVENLGLPADADGQRVWQTVYFLRRITITLTEARAILAHKAGPFLKRADGDAYRALAPHVRDTVAALDTFLPPLANVRNALGAHVRPQNAEGAEEGVEGRVLANHPKLEGTVHILGPTRDVSYRELSTTALLFAWPDADDDEKIEQRNVELQQAVLGSTGDVFRIVDALLGVHWWKHGVIDVPPEFDIGVLDKRTDALRPVQRPVK